MKYPIVGFACICASLACFGKPCRAAEGPLDLLALRLSRLPAVALKDGKNDAEVIDALYLGTLLRKPTRIERKELENYLKAAILERPTTCDMSALVEHLKKRVDNREAARREAVLRAANREAACRQLLMTLVASKEFVQLHGIGTDVEKVAVFIDKLYPGKNLKPKELANLWGLLGSSNATAAHDALWLLVRSPRNATPFLARQLKHHRPDPRRLAQLFVDLDSKQFAVRQRAMRELEEMGDAALPAIGAKLKEKPPLEVRLRLETLQQGNPANRLRQVRALQVLQYIDNADARKVVDQLAQGPPEIPLTNEAKAALKRME